MSERVKPEGLMLTNEEAFSLLGLCLTSPTGLDGVSEKALKKLAEYCSKSNLYSLNSAKPILTCELGKAGV